jgi:hypothetical protein
MSLVSVAADLKPVASSSKASAASTKHGQRSSISSAVGDSKERGKADADADSDDDDAGLPSFKAGAKRQPTAIAMPSAAAVNDASPAAGTDAASAVVKAAVVAKVYRETCDAVAEHYGREGRGPAKAATLVEYLLHKLPSLLANAGMTVCGHGHALRSSMFHIYRAWLQADESYAAYVSSLKGRIGSCSESTDCGQLVIVISVQASWGNNWRLLKDANRRL